VNEAHAWVEVNDSYLWHQIDLGGAALDLNQESDPTKPQHQPPQDPFTWPEGSQANSGHNLAQHEQHENGNGSDPSQSPGPNNGSSALDPSSDPTGPSSNSDLPKSKIELEVTEKSIRRGKALKVKGKVIGAQTTCRNVRVDIVVRHEDQQGPRTIGSLSTDDDGLFEGSVVVPRDITAGDYDVFVTTRGDKRCGAGRSE